MNIPTDPINFNGETFTYLFKKIIKKAYPEETHKFSDCKDIDNWLKDKTYYKVFGFKLEKNNIDPSYPIPAKDEKTGLLNDDLDAKGKIYNLKTAILDDPEVTNLNRTIFNHRRSTKNSRKDQFYTKYEYKGKRLYELYKALFSKDTTYHKKSFFYYGLLFLKYAGFKNLDELEKEINDKKNENDKTKNSPTSYNNHVTIDKEYVCLYYHWQKMEIIQKKVAIKYLSNRQANVTFFQNAADVNEPVFSNLCSYSRGQLLGVLNSNQDEVDKIILAIKSGTVPHNERGLHCSLIIPSAHGTLVTMEGFLIEQKHLKMEESGPETLKEVSNYLMLRHNTFLLPNGGFNISPISARQVEISKLNQMIGIFRVWRFDDDFNILQSVLTIDDSLKCTCRTYRKGKKKPITEKCEITPTNQQNHQSNSLYIHSYQKNYRERIVSTMVIRLLDNNENEKFTGGTLIFTSHKSGFSSARAIALMKEDPNAKINPEIISIEQAEEIAKSDGKIHLLYKTLLEMDELHLHRKGNEDIPN